MTFEIFLESLHHALIDTAAALPFLFLAYLLMEAAEHYQSARMEKAISGMGKAGPLVGAALGCIPQCGFSASASNLYAAGLIDRLPRLISVQAEGCCPLNRAIQTGEPWSPMEENTLADSIAVGVPRNADKALMAIRESQGVAVNVSDGEILAAMRLLGRTCGVFGEPAGVTGTAGVKKALELGLIDPASTVVSVVTGNGLKDVANGIQAAGEPMLVRPDMDCLLSAFAQRSITP